jgi:hypothetical protein
MNSITILVNHGMLENIEANIKKFSKIANYIYWRFPEDWSMEKNLNLMKFSLI